MYIHPLLRNKWFWVGFAVLLLLSVISDLFITSVIVVKSLFSGRWDSYLLSLGVIYATLSAYGSIYKDAGWKQILRYNRLLLLICFVWAWSENNFFIGMYFVVTLFIIARVMKWLLQLSFRRTRKRSGEPEVLSGD